MRRNYEESESTYGQFGKKVPTRVIAAAIVVTLFIVVLGSAALFKVSLDSTVRNVNDSVAGVSETVRTETRTYLNELYTGSGELSEIITGTLVENNQGLSQDEIERISNKVAELLYSSISSELIAGSTMFNSEEFHTAVTEIIEQEMSTFTDEIKQYVINDIETILLNRINQILEESIESIIDNNSMILEMASNIGLLKSRVAKLEESVAAVTNNLSAHVAAIKSDMSTMDSRIAALENATDMETY